MILPGEGWTVMSDEDRDLIENAWAQASAAQAVLLGLLIALKRRDQTEVIEEAFHIAGETFVQASLLPMQSVSRPATRALQVVDHMRKTVVGKDVPK